MKKFFGAVALALALTACHTPESNLERVCATATAVAQDPTVGADNKGTLVAEREGTFFNLLNNKEYGAALSQVAFAEPHHKSEPLHAYAKKNAIAWDCPAVDQIFGPPRTTTATKS